MIRPVLQNRGFQYDAMAFVALGEQVSWSFRGACQFAKLDRYSRALPRVAFLGSFLDAFTELVSQRLQYASHQAPPM